MTLPIQSVHPSQSVPTLETAYQAASDALIAEFFQRSQGKWHSDRRYYTLPNGDTKEIVSLISIRFLMHGCEELRSLARMHKLEDETIMTCGAEVIWDSADSVSGKKQSQGSTLFGAKSDILYRDRGFATPDPVTAQFYFTHPETLCLRTEYKGSTFEEELKLIGQQYRTRQTIITRSGEQQMIGQYLEKRMN